jgi:ATP-dependent DNA helicase RecG
MTDPGRKSVTTPALAEQRPVTVLKGVGEALAKRLERLGVTRVQDLLFLLPTRYEDRTRIMPIGSLQLGARAVIEGEIEMSSVAMRRRRQLLCRLGDGTGSITLRFFHFYENQLPRGTRIRCFGEVRGGPGGLEMVHPEYQRASVAEAAPATLTPVYPGTEGVPQERLRQLTALALQELANSEVRDWLPPEVLQPLDLPTLADALRYVHRPPPDAELDQLASGLHPAQRRLAFEELLAQHLSLRLLRKQHAADAGWPVPQQSALAQEFLGSLPFALTGAQARVWRDIAADMSQPTPMTRLVQGDVGCGKTVVAALAAVQAFEAGLQTAVMAPTELLAEQHGRNFVQWLTPLEIPVVLLTGKLKGRARASARELLASDRPCVAVGTHALFQDTIAAGRLGLIIIDEQHRFGVEQRLQLREKGASQGRYPHQLIMTATPIPRTLAMTAHADLDISSIDELPPGRTPVHTIAVPDVRREEVITRIRAACLQKRQAYWVCPLIAESEQLEAQAAEDTAELLAQMLPELAVGLVHGRMNAAAKESVMASFKQGEIDLLVATTVIEVGVDVPNASLMIIENAERMGLSQLHQLRGRVGRGATASNCVLLYKAPLTETARERLSAMRDTNDGFEIARRDLKLRGPGELLGTRQTGIMQYRVADLARDADLLPRIHEAATLILEHHESAIAPLLARWIGAGERFGKV